MRGNLSLAINALFLVRFKNINQEKIVAAGHFVILVLLYLFWVLMNTASNEYPFGNNLVEKDFRMEKKQNFKRTL